MEGAGRGLCQLTNVTILNIAPGFLSMLCLDLGVRLLDEVLQEHLGCDGDAEGGIVAAVASVWIDVDNLLYSGHFLTCQRASAVSDTPWD